MNGKAISLYWNSTMSKLQATTQEVLELKGTMASVMARLAALEDAAQGRKSIVGSQ